MHDLLAAHGLRIVGHLVPEELPFAQIILIGADGEAMWAHFRASPEAQDGARDPMDRWSARVLGAVAEATGAEAFFPFGGPPWQPFLAWSRAGEGARVSPVAMQVSPDRGLWMSYRGALGLREPLALPEPDTRDPCLNCPAPCLSACPVDALAEGSYNVYACVDHVNSTQGSECLSGCKVRLACPVGAPPPLAQRKFHMEAFIDARNAVRLASGN